MLWGRCLNKKEKATPHIIITNSNSEVSLTYLISSPIHPMQQPMEPNNVYPRTPSVFHSIKVSTALHVIKCTHRAVPLEGKQDHRHGREKNAHVNVQNISKEEDIFIHLTTSTLQILTRQLKTEEAADIELSNGH